MISIDDIRTYLPKYLSPESETRLFEALERFPGNLDERIYTIKLKDEKFIFQGDGLRNLPVINLPNREIQPAPVMVLSNSCDIGPEKINTISNNIVYAPIFRFEKYKVMIETVMHNPISLKSHLEDVRRQQISSIFFLPRGGSLDYDAIVRFDYVVNCKKEFLNNFNIVESRIFTLSNYGLYLFLFKLSVHFTRMRENIDRII